MARWEPDAAGRLRRAAVELFAQRGLEATTVTAIAERAGVTERTFFRHFTDKREVLFSDQGGFAAVFIDGVNGATAEASPLEAVSAGIYASLSLFPPEAREDLRIRNTVIAANPGLQERELLKMAAVAAGMATALRERGVPEPTATIAARSAIAVLSSGFDAWLLDGERRELPELIAEGFDQLRTLGHHRLRTSSAHPSSPSTLTH